MIPLMAFNLYAEEGGRNLPVRHRHYVKLDVRADAVAAAAQHHAANRIYNFLVEVVV